METYSRTMGLLLVLALAFALCLPAAATTYYVSPSGNDSNSGLTSAAAWATIDNGDVKQKLNSGDTVTVLAGTYNVTSAGSGVPRYASNGIVLTASNGVTYQAQGQVTVTRGTDHGCAFHLSGQNNWYTLGRQRLHIPGRRRVFPDKQLVRY